MDLRSGHPYWLVKNGITATYPPLQQDVQTEVAIIGAGITGALVAYLLTKQGVGVVVLDKRDAAWGSTSACTALVQYEIDTNLYQLKLSIGEADAVRAYRLGIEAIDAIAQIAEELRADCHFQRRRSVYLARRKQEERALCCEYTARRQGSFNVSYLEAEPLWETYGIAARAAIVSEQAAELDPYLLTHQLLAGSQAQGAQIFDRTEVKDIQQQAGQVVLQTDREHVIRANKVVIATGYEVHQYLKQPIVDLNSTYALITEPVDILQTLQGRYLLWEIARPYFYLRSTPEQRIIIGGVDEPFRNPARRDKLIGKKSQQLLKMFAELYPQAERLEVAYAWAGTFGETKDGLPYIGESPTMANAYVALGYGGNGVTYSMIAARIICDLYLGKANADARLFRFDR